MLHSYVIPSRLYISNTSWKYVGLVLKHPGVMSLKCGKSVGSVLYKKNEDAKAVRHFEENNYQAMTYTQTATK